MTDLIDPKPIIVTDGEGVEKEYYLSKLPAYHGRKIMYTYALANMPKLGSPEKSMEIAEELMAYVAVNIAPPEAEKLNLIRLDSVKLINNHLSDWEVFGKLEKAMLIRNNSFFRNGQILGFFDGLAQVVIEKIIKILTASSEQSSQAEEPL